MVRVGIALFVLLVAGCGPKVKSYAYLNLESLPSDQDVVVFAETLPGCEYEQVGLIAANDLKRAKDRARKMGADGLIGDPEAESGSNRAKAAVCGTPNCVTFNTVAIRFLDPTCRQ